MFRKYQSALGSASLESAKEESLHCECIVDGGFYMLLERRGNIQKEAHDGH